MNRVVETQEVRQLISRVDGIQEERMIINEPCSIQEVRMTINEPCSQNTGSKNDNLSKRGKARLNR